MLSQLYLVDVSKINLYTYLKVINLLGFKWKKILEVY